MKKSLYFIVVVLLCVTTGAQLFAYEYDVQNTTNYEIAAQLIFNGPPGSSGKKVIAPKSTANFKMSGSNTASCLSSIRYTVNPSQNNKELSYKFPTSICKSAEIVITPTSTPNEVQFITQR